MKFPTLITSTLVLLAGSAFATKGDGTSRLTMHETHVISETQTIYQTVVAIRSTSTAVNAKPSTTLEVVVSTKTSLLAKKSLGDGGKKTKSAHKDKSTVWSDWEPKKPSSTPSTTTSVTTSTATVTSTVTTSTAATSTATTSTVSTSTVSTSTSTVTSSSTAADSSASSTTTVTATM